MPYFYLAVRGLAQHAQGLRIIVSFSYLGCNFWGGEGSLTKTVFEQLVSDLNVE